MSAPRIEPLVPEPLVPELVDALGQPLRREEFASTTTNATPMPEVTLDEVLRAGERLFATPTLDLQARIEAIYGHGRVEILRDVMSGETTVLLGMERLSLNTLSADYVESIARHSIDHVLTFLALMFVLPCRVFCSPCLIHRDRGEGLDPADVCASNPRLGLACARGR